MNVVLEFLLAIEKTGQRVVTGRTSDDLLMGEWCCSIFGIPTLKTSVIHIEIEIHHFRSMPIYTNHAILNLCDLNYALFSLPFEAIMRAPVQVSLRLIFEPRCAQ